MGDGELQDDWVVVDVPKKSVIEHCKEKGYSALRYFRKVLLLYRVYRMVRLLINIYIIYHTLMPNHFPLF